MMHKKFHWQIFIGCLCIYITALSFLYLSIPHGVARETVHINGPDDKACVGTLWTPPEPVAVIVLGHGITGNQGIMATLAKNFAANGYAALTLDFWGHGLSRERFSMLSNPGQLHAWYAWARAQYPGLPLVYLGYSMGGVSGELALRQGASMDAYISLGMLPRRLPEFPTLIAAGRFEELFSSEEALQRAADHADVLISPYSNHILEGVDPVLVQGIMTWVDDVLGFDRTPRFSPDAYVLVILGVALGFGASLFLAGCALLPLRYCARTTEAPQIRRRWSVNPYRLVGRLMGCVGHGAPTLSAVPLPIIVFQGMLFFLLFIVLLSFVLSGHVYSYALLHPWRWLAWLMLLPVLAPLILLDAWTLERLALGGSLQRFLAPAITRSVPLLVMAVGLRYVPGFAFFGMTLGLWAFIFVLMSAVHALATRGAGDYRAGAIASAVFFTWIVTFCSPQLLG